MAGICTSSYSSSYPIEKVGDSSYLYSYPYPVNIGIFRQNRKEYGQYPKKRVYLSSLVLITSYYVSIQFENNLIMFQYNPYLFYSLFNYYFILF